MIKKSEFIILGSTGRNTGKTEFACRLINRFSKTSKVIGIKVTSIDRDEGFCPRGPESCGVCASLKNEYDIIEETENNTGKDTSRMLNAGAHKVYWLKVDKNYIEKGIKALIEQLPMDALIVAESNSLRTVIEPGLFIVIKNKNDQTIKEGCSQVIGFANKIIEFDNMSWDFSPDRILVKNNTWIIKEKATAIILAGGKSSRMGGEDKSLLPVDGKPMILNIINQLEDYFDEIIIGANDNDKYRFLNRIIIPDIEKEKGPLMGILSCVKASSNEINFITACDIPIMNIKLIQNMINLSADVDIVMPIKEQDKHEPLFAIYKKSVIKDTELILQNNGRKIIELLKKVKVRLVEFDAENWYQNLNRKEDYYGFIKKVEYRNCQRNDSPKKP